MKFLKKVTIILFLGLLVSSCQTTGRVKIDDFTVNMNSPKITVGEVELQFETMMGMGKLKKQNVDVFYFPKEDAVCLTYKYEFYTYNQFWDRRGRRVFISALQKYNEDYEARNLERNTNKTQLKYGTVRGYLIWQQAAFTVQAFANMNVDLGYTFKERSPYFTIYQRDTEYIDENARDNNRISPNLTMYFTRAQAAELAEIFEQYVNNLPSDYEEPPSPGKKDDIPKDIY